MVSRNTWALIPYRGGDTAPCMNILIQNIEGTWSTCPLLAPVPPGWAVLGLKRNAQRGGCFRGGGCVAVAVGLGG